MHQSGLPLEVTAKASYVATVSLDTGMTTERSRDFGPSNGFTFAVLHDSSGHISPAVRTTVVPEPFVIAADGTIRKERIGASDSSGGPNRALVTELLLDANGR